jgi:hypothetical protein
MKPKALYFWLFITLLCWFVPVSLHAQVPARSDPNFIYHEVKPGHTLYTIARRYGLSLEELRSLNSLQSNSIYPGQWLIVGRRRPLPDPRPNSAVQPASPAGAPVTIDPYPQTETAAGAEDRPPVPVPVDRDGRLVEIFHAQEGKFYRRVYTTSFSISTSMDRVIRKHIDQLTESAEDKDLLVASIYGRGLDMKPSMLRYFARLKGRKLLILDLELLSKFDDESFRNYQSQHDLICILVRRQSTDSLTPWQSGALRQAVYEGLEGAADMNRDRVVSLHELDFYLNERVGELTGNQQRAYIPFNGKKEVKLIQLD